MNKPYPIFLIEDDKYTREHLQRAVDSHPDLYVCEAVDSLTNAYSALKKQPNPTVALIDLGLPDGSGLDLIQKLSKQPNPVDCMVVSTLGDEQHVMAALSAGATGYILKDSRLDTIANDIVTLIAGGSPISPKIARHLLKRFNQPTTNVEEVSEKPKLTARESDILLYISKGYKRREIADSMSVSINTIGTHIKHIYQKLSVNTNIEAIQEACRFGLL